MIENLLMIFCGVVVGALAGVVAFFIFYGIGALVFDVWENISNWTWRNW